MAFRINAETKNINGKVVPLCNGCKTAILGFRNEKGQEEFKLSGLCQNCQDGVFLVNLSSVVTQKCCMICKQPTDSPSDHYNVTGLCNFHFKNQKKRIKQIITQIQKDVLDSLMIDANNILNIKQIKFKGRMMFAIKTLFNTNHYPSILLVNPQDPSDHIRLNKNLQHKYLKSRIAIREDLFTKEALQTLMVQEIIYPRNEAVPYGFLKARVYEILF